MDAPKKAKTYQIGIENFNGIDLKNSLSKVAPNRSPMCPNMIRNTIGENRKRYGYETLFSFGDKINGIHVLKTDADHILIHAGENMYLYEHRQATTTPIFDSDDYNTYPQSVTITEQGSYQFTLKGGKGADRVFVGVGTGKGGAGGIVKIKAELDIGDVVKVDLFTNGSGGGDAYAVYVNDELYAIAGGGGGGGYYASGSGGDFSINTYKGAAGGGDNGADGTTAYAPYATLGMGAVGNTAGVGGGMELSNATTVAHKGYDGSGNLGGYNSSAGGAGGCGYGGGGQGGYVARTLGLITQTAYATGGGGSSFAIESSGVTVIENSQGTNDSTAKALVEPLEWVDSTPLYTSANDDYSVSAQMNGKLYILDGANYLVFDGESVEPVSDSAYIPTTTIAKTYEGGGTALEPINLITPFRTERFTGDDTHDTFQLGATDIDDDEVTIESMQNDGTFTTLVEGTDFSVDRTDGTFTLDAPIETPIVGVDNLYVTYAKTIDGYADKINKCDIMIVYGANGLRDRLFVSGNPDFKNYDWYCKSNDPTYFGDTWYSVIGQDDASIIGYSIINDRLVTHKDTDTRNTNANLRTGSIVNGEVVFASAGSYPATGALAKRTFASFRNEPLYVSIDNKIESITPNDVIGERISQERSYFLNFDGVDLTNSYGITHNGFYCLAVDDKVYLLDSAQPVYERNSPYSARQYEAYMFTGINARILFSYNGELWFGTDDGKIKRFGTPDHEIFTDDSYTHDVTVMVDGQKKKYTESFPCYWETAEFYGTAPQMKKTFRHLAVAMNTLIGTSCRVWARINGEWEILFDYDDPFENHYEDFIEEDETSTIIGGKFRASGLLHIQFRFENSRPQPFGLLWAIAEYTVGNEYRK